MIQVQNLTVQFGDRILFRNGTFQINADDKIALIGRNGAGKTTLLNIIEGHFIPDQGVVNTPRGLKISHLEQTLHLDVSKSIKDTANEAFSQVLDLEEANNKLQEKLETFTDYESPEYLQLIEDINNNLDRLNHFDQASVDKKVELVLKGLGFDPDQFQRPISHLSGGWQMRVQMARLLLEEPDLLLLDEPTNHLDIEAIIWLENYIVNYPGAIILISHDRAFLRNTASRILEIENTQIYDYPLSYDRYLRQKADIQAKQEAAYRNQQREIASKEKTIKRFMAKASKTSMAQSMQKQLDKLERIEWEDTIDTSMRIRFLPVRRSARSVCQIQNLHKSYGRKKVLQGLTMNIDRGDRIAIVGQNGQGKTTLIKAMLEKVDIDHGDVIMGSNVDIGYYAQNQSDLLADNETVLEFLEGRAPEQMFSKIRHLLGAFLFSGDDVDKKIKVLSGGERARLALAHLLMQPINFLLLDEPTNHLDMNSKDILKQALLDYEGTLLVVSHDRDFLQGLTSKTYEMKDHLLFEHLGDINEFLEKRKLKDLREVAINKKPVVAKEETSPKIEIDYAKRKAILKKVKSTERKVLQLEEQINKIEEKMKLPGFFEDSGKDDILQKYYSLKSDLSEAELAWEKALDLAHESGL